MGSHVGLLAALGSMASMLQPGNIVRETVHLVLICCAVALAIEAQEGAGRLWPAGVSTAALKLKLQNLQQLPQEPQHRSVCKTVKMTHRFRAVWW